MEASICQECDKCNEHITVFKQHLSDEHGAGGENVDQLMQQLQTLDLNAQLTLPAPVIDCPVCSKDYGDHRVFSSTRQLLEHLKGVHNYTQIRDESISTNVNLPKVGDKVLAMWEDSMWQYFDATIREVMPCKTRYEIDWDDGDTTGRFVDYYNLAVNRMPEENEIGVDSIILFPQGGYRAGATQQTGGQRWHQGRITSVYQSEDGTTLYNGIHTKGEEDGKFVTYKDYSYTFEGYRLDAFRVGPNVFDILESEFDDSDEASPVDIYFSFDGQSSATQEIDPKEVVEQMAAKGINVIVSNDGLDLTKKAAMMKNAKVFIACIDDSYVKSETCRMEFQFAKKTLGKPVVPLVFGSGMDWQLSVVGLLISGELYIQFRDQTVKDAKLDEMFTTISTHLDRSDLVDGVEGAGNAANNDMNESVVDCKKNDIFLSYCWWNSNHAFENKQIPNLCGNSFADPRIVKQELTNAGYNTWLDIERLRSGDQGVGMFEQLAAALKEAKVVVACISNEYAKSANCRMEFQFACKGLQKPIVPLIVGAGNDWNETVVGMLLKGAAANVQPINLQELDSDDGFKAAMRDVLEKVEGTIGKAEDLIQANDDEEERKTGEKKVETKSNMPKIGDHVISHHLKHCYYTAVIVAYDASTMEYTVKWDDGDTSVTVQNYDQVAINEVPDQDDVGVDSIIFFPQGRYMFEESYYQRYHQGIVTKVHSTDGQVFVDGHHTKGEDDHKFLGYRDYDYHFCNITLESVRVAASALDTMV